MKQRILLLVIQALVVQGLLACDSFDEDLQYVQQLEAQGKFDLALREYRNLQERYEGRPEILAGQGRVYSTRRATVFAGEYMLRNALKQKNDRKLWWELVRLYIAMGWYAQAIDLVQEPYLNLDELFEPEIARLRDGLKCLDDPGRYARYRLEQTPDHLERDFFLGLCLLIDQPDQEQINDALALYKNIKSQDDRLACRMVNVWPIAAQPAVDFRSSELQVCKQKYVGDISISREPVLVPEKDADAYPIDRQLFQLNRFDPGDPGRSDRPQWPAPRELP